MKKHGDLVKEGDEYNLNPWYYCAKCGYSHGRDNVSCDGLRTPATTLGDMVKKWQADGGLVHPDLADKVNIKIPKAYTPNPLNTQEGGDHYKKMKIQPIEYIHANGIPFAEGCAIKYLTRWRDKGGVEDLKKARHFIDLLIELETRK